MRRYKLKRLEQTERDKQRIIGNRWRQVKQPARKKQANPWMVAFASIAFVVLCWSFIASPNPSLTEKSIEGVPLLRNIESIEIWKYSTGDSVVIEDEQQLQVLYAIITSALQQGANGQIQTDDFHYLLQMNERDFYSQGYIAVTKNQLSYLSKVAKLTDTQYNDIKAIFQNQAFINTTFNMQPITEEDGLFYFDVLTLADSKSAMINQYGYHYTERANEDGRYEADTIYDYGTIKVYMQADLIVAIENEHFYSIDFDDSYETFSERGFVEETPNPAYVASYYSEKTNQQITFEQNPSGNLKATLRYKMASE